MHSKDFKQHLAGFKGFVNGERTKCDDIVIGNKSYTAYTNEFWTAQQRQGNALHEVSYRACFKPQLPAFFLHLFTQPNDLVYDPFNGRGTTVIEAALHGRNIAANDVNPLSLMLTRPRINPPLLAQVKARLEGIGFQKKQKSDIDLSMFYHSETESEIVSLKNYLEQRTITEQEDQTDRWIRMVATNRLSGHSKGFFSVYTLPPNQAVSAERQKKINLSRKQKPEYRDVKKLILHKSKQLLNYITAKDLETMQAVKTQFINGDAAETKSIEAESVSLTVTSPPFLDIVQYAADNWLRCWFNGIDMKQVEGKITMSKTPEEWSNKMGEVINELFRITKKGGTLAFEVGEVRKGKIRLEELVIPLGVRAGFECLGVMINQQNFTKTANIWGINNNSVGTNSNRIVVFRKN
jgi:hypothetical protein